MSRNRAAPPDSARIQLPALGTGGLSLLRPLPRAVLEAARTAAVGDVDVVVGWLQLVVRRDLRHRGEVAGGERGLDGVAGGDRGLERRPGRGEVAALGEQNEAEVDGRLRGELRV